MKTEPRQAEIRVDGKKLGDESPIATPRLCPGVHELEVKAADYRSATARVEVSSDTLVTQTVVLDRDMVRGRKSVEDKMYGTWEGSAFFSTADVKELSEEPIPYGVEIEITMKKTDRYQKGGKYSGEYEITMRIRADGNEIPLRFYAKDSGDWSLHANGKELVQTSSGGTVTALDDLTKSFLKESPEAASFAPVAPVKGGTSTSHILSISDTLMEIEDDEFGVSLIMKKKR